MGNCTLFSDHNKYEVKLYSNLIRRGRCRQGHVRERAEIRKIRFAPRRATLLA